MPERLGRHNIVAFATIIDVEKAKEFYGGVLGLRLVKEEPPFALVYDANGIMVRLGMGKERVPFEGTVLGWEVQDIEATVGELAGAGVVFERYGVLPQDERGIWNTPDGSRVAWFKDPDGNTLSVSQHPDWRTV